MYCPQCGSSNVVKYTNKKNNNRLKSILNQMQKKTSTEEEHVICQDCGYSWEMEGYNEDQDFQDIDIQTFTYQDDDEESDQKKTGLHIFDNLKNKKGNDTEEKRQKNSNSEKEKQSGKILLIACGAVFIACMIILLVMYGVVHVGQAQVPDSASALKGENYQEVAEEFEEAGFTDVRTRTITESLEESLAKEGEIETVSVDGNDSFRSGKWFSKDDEVIISYHPELEKAQVPEAETSFEGKDYQEVIKEFEESGYTNIREDPLNDLVDDSTYKDGEVSMVSVLGDDSFDSSAIFPVEAEVIITYHAYPRVQVPDAASSFQGENYEDVIKKFEEAGFTNVKTEILYDLIVGWMTEVGEVESVSVDGDDSFDSDASYRTDAEVIVTYHDLTENDEDRVDYSEIEDTLNGLKGETLDKAKEQIEELGYTATYYHANTKEDFTSSINDIGDLSDWVVTDIKEINIFDETVDVYINTAENIKADQEKEDLTNKLKAKLDPYDAWVAVSEYGKKEYPYGFDLHYIVGQLAQEPEDEDTWYLKATCTITNVYNATAEYNCEARVTGTTDNPKVIDFKVY